MGTGLQRIEKGSGISSADYPKDKFNALAPMVVVGPEASYLQRSVHVVQLDPDHRKGDCYPAPGTKWSTVDGAYVPDEVAPSKSGLLRLAAAMGIVWQIDPIEPQSHRLMKNMCAGMNPAAAMELFNQVRYDCAYRVRFAVRDGSGWRFGTATYEWELETERRKIEREADKAEAKAKKDNKPFDRDSYIRERVEQVTNFRYALAESKALLRAIRTTGIRQKYTRQDFAKPFAVTRVDVVVDASDPIMAKAIAERALASGSELFGDSKALPAVNPSAPLVAEEQPDFEAAEREGRMNMLPPVDLVDEEEPEQTNGTPAAELFPAGPWDDEPTTTAPYTIEEARKRLSEVWARVQKAHIESKVGTLPKDATIDQIVSWCNNAEEQLKAVGK